MNPLKSLMAFGLAFGLAAPACFADVSRDPDGAKASKSQGISSDASQVPTVDGRAVAGTAGAESGYENFINKIAAVIKAHPDGKGPEIEGIAARVAEYLADAHNPDPDKPFIVDSYRKAAAASRVAALSKAIKDEVVKTVIPDEKGNSDANRLAVLYATLGDKSAKGALAADDILKYLNEPEDWFGDFQKLMAERSPRYAGPAGDKDDAKSLQSWTQGVVETAYHAAFEAASLPSSAKAKARIGANEENPDVPSLLAGRGAGKKVANATSFGSGPMYEEGGVVANIVYDPVNKAYRRISMKLTPERNSKTGDTDWALGLYDITDMGGDPPQGFGQTIPLIVGGKLQTGINQPFLLDDSDPKSVRYYLNISKDKDGNTVIDFHALSNPGPDGKLKDAAMGENPLTVDLLHQRLLNEVKDDGHRVTIPDTKDGRNYVIIPCVDRGMGCVQYFPADKDFNLTGDKPEFMADLTQVGDDGYTHPLSPPATALGCAGEHGGQERLCNGNGGKSPDNFYYMCQGLDSAVFDTCSCSQAQKTYQEPTELGGGDLKCAFEDMPSAAAKDKKTDAKTDNPDQPTGGAGASGATTDKTAPPTPTPAGGKGLRDCAELFNGKPFAYKDWKVYVQDGNASFLCAFGDEAILMPGLPAGVIGMRGDYFVAEAVKVSPLDNATTVPLIYLLNSSTKELDPSLYFNNTVAGNGGSTVGKVEERDIFYVQAAHVTHDYIQSLNKDKNLNLSLDFLFSFHEYGSSSKDTDADTIDIHIAKDATPDQIIGLLKAALAEPPAKERTFFRDDAQGQKELAAAENYIKVTLTQARQQGLAEKTPDFLVSLFNHEEHNKALCEGQNSDASKPIVQLGTSTTPYSALAYYCDDPTKLQTDEEHTAWLNAKQKK